MRPVRTLPETPKREGVPTTTVFPRAFDRKTDLSEQGANALVCKLVTIFGVNGFASHEVNVKARVLDTYVLLLRALEVHLDPRICRVPQCAMTETNGVKVSS